MRTASKIIGAVLLVSACIASAAADPIDADTVLRKMLDSESSVSFTARQITTISRKPSLTSEQIVYRSGFRGMRIEYVEPALMRGEIMADDGRQLAHFIPKAKVLKIRPSRLAHLRLRTEQAVEASREGHLTAELVGRDKIAGRAAYLIVVKPKSHRHGPTRKFWVDTEKWIKLKTEDIAPDGSVASTSYYTEIDFVNSISDEKFRFDAPPGVRVEREAGPPGALPLDKAREMVKFRILEPAHLPPGFKFVGASVMPFREGKFVALRYSDGVTSFSLFQTPGRTLHPKFLHRLHEGPVRPGKGIYSWRRGELNLTLVGPLSSEEIRKIAASMK